MHVSVLGPLQVRDDEGGPLAVSGARLRVLLTRLALDAGRPVPADRLVHAVWDADEPGGAANALQSLVSRLRRMLGTHRIRSGPAGYTLAVEPDAVDVHRFERSAADGRTFLAAGDLVAADRHLTAALALWRGPALADAAGAAWAVGPAARLEEMRLTAVEDRIDARLRLGRAHEAVAELEQLAAEHPLRERLHGQLVAALDTVGRRADALSAYQALRDRLAEELGIDPSPELDAVHLAVLRGERTVVAISVPPGDETAAVPGGDTGEGAAEAAEPQPTAAAEPPVPEPGAPAAPAPPAAPTRDPVADRGSTTRSTNLTLRLTSFVGRVDERAKLAGLLAESRLVSVVGPGGAGKTRITVETGRERLPDYPGGVWFVELASVHDPLDIPHAIVSALGRRDVGILGDLLETTTGKTTRGRDALSQVVETLSRRPALLILDNCEHLVGATAEIADLLLGEVPSLHILTSTREPLGVLGETLYPLGPLALPPSNAGADEAMRYPAVRLFADRASAVRPGLAVDDANLAAVVEICRRLDGMPLAIELAAARTRALSPQQIATRLDDRFRLLTGGNRTAMPRHQTLRAVVEWSWDLLDDRERAVLRRLSVFAGGATLDAAEEVLPDGYVVHRDDVLDLLTGLVDKSLVDVFGTGEPRYRMLETIAAFAAEHRERADETETTGARHLVWCKAMLDAVEPELRGRGQLAGLAAVGAEHDNIAAALRHAVDRDDTASALAIVGRLGWYWQIRGYHREARTWMAEALALPYDEVTTDRANAEWFYGMTLAVSGREPESLRWLMRARWHVRHFDPEAMPPTLRLMRALTAALRDYHLGTFSAEELEPDPAYYNDPWTRGFHDLIRGHLAVNVGMTDAGLRWLRAARAQFAEIGERWGHSSAVAGLSEVYAYTGRLDDAIAAIGEGLGLVRELGAPEDMPMLLIRRSLLRVIIGDRAGAQADVDEAAQVAADGETAGGMMLAYAGAADIARLMGDLAEAERLFAKALREMERSHNRPGQVSARMFLGIAYIADSKGDRTGARDALDRATVVALDTRDMPIIAGVAEGLAWWAQTEGDSERAALLLGAAVTLRGHTDLGHPDVVRITGDVRAALAPEVFDREFARGAALPPAEAEELMRRS
ncbi:hypothetical protein GCM10023205_44560 [Yinghuangia aomiensis]|uniref:OmpR/PhoB-type domain-containing protein n=1 Tax=Yinghuangia aomiensis TaxID=676205 RepID=A0ABP9HLB2_9ACTN